MAERNDAGGEQGQEVAGGVRGDARDVGPRYAVAGECIHRPEVLEVGDDSVERSDGAAMGCAAPEEIVGHESEQENDTADDQRGHRVEASCQGEGKAREQENCQRDQRAGGQEVKWELSAPRGEMSVVIPEPGNSDRQG